MKARRALLVAAAALAALLALAAPSRPAAAHASSAENATVFAAAMDKSSNLPDPKVAEARLLRNQADIGTAIKPYDGAAAAAG